MCWTVEFLVVLTVLCLGVDFGAVCTLCAFSYFYLGLGNWVATYWEIAAHSAYDMFFSINA